MPDLASFYSSPSFATYLMAALEDFFLLLCLSFSYECLMWISQVAGYGSKHINLNYVI